ncbi:MAG: hypothetical protein NC517_08640, partial [Firmicutes bacterium]|nr:hypothetical protein [Bacillota bacterium]
GAAAGGETMGAGAAGGAAAGGGAVGAAVTGGLGMLKIGLIALAAVAVVSLGAYGATRIASDVAESQEPPTTEDSIDRKESEIPEKSEIQSESEAPGESEAVEETEAPDEPAPIDEALEQYRIIVGQADSYEYGEYAEANWSWLEFVGYRYALVQMQPEDQVPTLLLGREIKDTEQSITNVYIRVFKYEPDTGAMHQPPEVVTDGYIRGGLSMAGDGYGMFDLYWYGGTGEGSVQRITLDEDSLNRETWWSGQIFEMPDSITFVEIEWHEIEDLSALDRWTAPEPGGAASSEPSDNDTLPVDGDRIVLTGTVIICDYDGIVELQGEPDPAAIYFTEDYWEEVRSRTYQVIVLDTPQTLRLLSSAPEGGYFEGELSMIAIWSVEDMSRYEGQHITFSIDPSNTLWPTDTRPPIRQPGTTDIHILE